MDAHSNPKSQRRSKMIDDGAETKETGRRAADSEQRCERLRNRRERDRARHTAQTASKRQAASQQISTREHERMAAETPEEKDYIRKVM